MQQRRFRKDGWTAEKRQIFLDHLAASANVAHSAKAAGMHANSAYKLQRRDADFALLWREALATGYSRLEAMLIERAATGPDRGNVPGDTPVDDPRTMDAELALALLRRHKEARTKPRVTSPQLPRASTKELTNAILAKLELLNKRLGRKNRKR